MSVNTQVLFVQRPAKGKLDYQKVFEVSKKRTKPTAADLKPNEVLVRNVVLGFDAAMRAWMGELKTYREPLQLGQLMDGNSVSVVIASRSPKFAVGDRIIVFSGWQEYSVFNAESEQGRGAEKLPAGIAFEDAQYISGGTAMTAYFGLLAVGEMKKGDTVIVSGAAGATGSMVGQLAKALGAGKVIGIAGGKEKCEYLKRELGYDEAIDYKVDRKVFSRALSDALRGTKGCDLYFDNTGGMITEVVFNRFAMRARMVVCGTISSYEGTAPPQVNVALGNLVATRAQVRGLLVMDFKDRYDEGKKHLAELVKQGKLKSIHTTLNGIENAPLALAMLFDGKNNGKMQCRLCSDEEVAKELAAAPKL
ncbi:hypothetical protein DFJ74DRAFT_699211 [Hyaloraphidium curvatum]|nr:hypothetical protein DFJ74DRAFT_699211 [Hyaloraphidium curvatum]